MRPVTPDEILRLGMGFWASKALLSAVELRVFTVLAQSPADFQILRTKLGLHERSARDFLDALVALKVLERNGETYRNSPEADLFLDKAKPSHLGDGERPTLWLFGLTHRGPENRPTPERGQTRGRLLRHALRRTGAITRLLRSD